MTSIDARSRPSLARGVRLRRDRITGKALLLRPEQGFELQGSALEIVELCNGESTFEEIIDRLCAAHTDVERAQIAEDVQRLLSNLKGRGLIRWEEP